MPIRILPILIALFALGACERTGEAPGAAPGDVPPARPAPADSTPAAPSPMPASPEPAATPDPTRTQVALVDLQPTEGNTASGRLEFRAERDGVRITGRIGRLGPDTVHGFHVHETGDCSAPDASTAGEHFNPDGQPHGNPADGPHHAGDIPNQRADAAGNADVDEFVAGLDLGTGSATDVAGRALVLHAQPDDYTSQPSGDSGARIACGVIGG